MRTWAWARVAAVWGALGCVAISAGALRDAGAQELQRHADDAVVVAPPAGDEPGQGFSRRHVADLLIAGKYAELDAMAAEFRTSKARLPGGQWKLRMFYGALDRPYSSDADTVQHLERLREWMKQRPRSITARVALATSLHRWAWVARGNGYANTVSAEAARLFHERIAEANVVLESARDMKEMDPQWFVCRMTVGIAEGWSVSQEEEVFRRGVQFEPEYQFLYKHMVQFLQPKWYGRPGDVAKFMTAEADRLGRDNGDLMYFEMAREVIGPKDGGNTRPAELDWARIQRGYGLMKARWGAAPNLDNELAFLAWRFGDRDVARLEFAAIGPEWDASVWRNRLLFDRARDWSTGRENWP